MTLNLMILNFNGQSWTNFLGIIFRFAAMLMFGMFLAQLLGIPMVQVFILALWTKMGAAIMCIARHVKGQFWTNLEPTWEGETLQLGNNRASRVSGESPPYLSGEPLPVYSGLGPDVPGTLDFKTFKIGLLD